MNVNGTINLLEASRKQGIKHFIFASTEWVYDKNEKKINSENDDIIFSKMNSEYSISKMVCEQILKNYARFFKITILRFGIIYSNRIGIGSAIESLVHKVINEEKIQVGSLRTSRNFIHIDDIISGINASIKLPKAGIFNLTGDKNINLKEIIRIAGHISRKKTNISELNKNNPSIRIVTNKKAKKYLKWRPKINIQEGIKRILIK